MPEAFVKPSVGNTPYPETEMFVPEAFVYASVGKRPYVVASIAAEEETFAREDWPDILSDPP